MAQSTSTTVFASPNKSSTSRASVADASNPPVQLLEEAAHRRVCCRCHETHDLLLNPPSRTRTLLWHHRWLVVALLLLFFSLLFLYDYGSFCVRYLAFLRVNNMDTLSYRELFRRYLAGH